MPRRKPSDRHLLEALIMDVAGINTQLSTIQSTIGEVKSKVDALIAAGAGPAPVATQADLDAISSQLASAQASLDAIKAS